MVTGELGLAGELDVDLLDNSRLTYSDEFIIADVAGDLVGQFNGLNEGDLVASFEGMDLFITYNGGDGNDVTLFTSVPEPGTGALLLLSGIFALGLRRKRR